MKNFTLDDIRDLIESSLKPPPTGDSFIDNRYADHIAKFNDELTYYRLFYHLANTLQPDLTVELGAWQATAAAHFASGWPAGEVITIDHHSDPGDDINKIKAEEAMRHYNNLFYIQSWTWDALASVKALNKPIDILFIDSWHQYEYARKDWNNYSPLVGSPGLVICDDILGGDGPVIAGMMRFWEELPGEKFLDGRIHAGFPMGFIKM